MNKLEQLAAMRAAARRALPSRVPDQPASGATQAYVGTRSSRPTQPVRRVSR